MGIPQYFSATYAEARRKFLEAARAAGAAIESHVNPNSKGPNGEELATDVARFGDMDAENLFITCSGTHGNEGFCGSGCQIGFIKEGIISARPKSVGVLLVHAATGAIPVGRDQQIRDFGVARILGQRLGEVLEIAVEIHIVLGHPADMGKAVG